MDFGLCKQSSPLLPRIKVWKDNMISKYSSYDCVGGNIYGKRPVSNIGKVTEVFDLGKLLFYYILRIVFVGFICG